MTNFYIVLGILFLFSCCIGLIKFLHQTFKPYNYHKVKVKKSFKKKKKNNIVPIDKSSEYIESAWNEINN